MQGTNLGVIDLSQSNHLSPVRPYLIRDVTEHQPGEASLSSIFSFQPCCISNVCFMLPEQDCIDSGGDFYSDQICLEDGGTVDCTTPADENSWGAVKAAYR